MGLSQLINQEDNLTGRWAITCRDFSCHMHNDF